MSFVDKLKRLHGEATPYPWVIPDSAPNEYWRDFGKIVCHGGEGGVRVCDTTENYTGAHTGKGIDAQLIALLRNKAGAIIALVEAAEELAELMRGVIDGDYKPDGFTLQPIDNALSNLNAEES